MNKEQTISRREALKRIGRFSLSVVAMTVLPRIEADAQYYYKYYNYYNSGYGCGDYTKYYNYYSNYYNYYSNYSNTYSNYYRNYYNRYYNYFKLG